MRPYIPLLLAALLAGCAPAQPSATAVGTPSAESASATPTPSPAQPARIGLSYIPNIQFAPFYLAEDDGLFEPDATWATVRHHGAQEGLFTAIAAGQEDFVIAGGDEALQAREQGIDLVAIATLYRENPVQVIVRADGPITGLADLAGRRIGVPGRYGTSWFGLLVALRSAGLTEDEVEVVEIGYTQQAALTTDKVDAVVGFSNNDLVQFRLAGVDVVGLPVVEDGVVPLAGASLITTRAYLDAHPEVARGVAQAMVDGVAAVAADPERALDVAATHVPGLDQGPARSAARATLDATVKIMLTPDGRADGSLDPATWQAMAQFMTAAGLLTTAPDVAAAIAPQVLGS